MKITKTNEVFCVCGKKYNNILIEINAYTSFTLCEDCKINFLKELTKYEDANDAYYGTYANHLRARRKKK